MSDHLVWDVIYPEAPDSYQENPKADPHWEWPKEPEVREAVRPQVAELARVATFLASEGMALNATAYALFVDAVSDNLLLPYRCWSGAPTVITPPMTRLTVSLRSPKAPRGLRGQLLGTV